jgi:hypothetical protein
MAPPLKEDVPVGVKAGQNAAIGMITGPSCSPNAVGLRDLQAGAMVPPLAALALAALALAALALAAGIALWRRQAPAA